MGIQHLFWDYRNVKPSSRDRFRQELKRTTLRHIGIFVPGFVVSYWAHLHARIDLQFATLCILVLLSLINTVISVRRMNFIGRVRDIYPGWNCSGSWPMFASLWATPLTSILFLWFLATRETGRLEDRPRIATIVLPACFFVVIFTIGPMVWPNYSSSRLSNVFYWTSGPTVHYISSLGEKIVAQEKNEQARRNLDPVQKRAAFLAEIEAMNPSEYNSIHYMTAFANSHSQLKKRELASAESPEQFVTAMHDYVFVIEKQGDASMWLGKLNPLTILNPIHMFEACLISLVIVANDIYTYFVTVNSFQYFLSNLKTKLPEREGEILGVQDRLHASRAYKLVNSARDSSLRSLFPDLK